MDKHLWSRRELGALSARVGLAFAVTTLARRVGATALAATTDAVPASTVHTVRFPGGKIVPAVGQGSWHLGEGRHPAADGEQALSTGVSLGMTLIDTSGNYADGRSEELIGRAIAGERDKIFLVTKVEAREVVGHGMAKACEASLGGLRPTLSTFICCTGRSRSCNSPVWSRASKSCAPKAGSAPGASQTSASRKWTSFSACQTVIAAPPIRCLIVSTTAGSSATCCRGAKGTTYR